MSNNKKAGGESLIAVLIVCAALWWAAGRVWDAAARWVADNQLLLERIQMWVWVTAVAYVAAHVTFLIVRLRTRSGGGPLPSSEKTVGGWDDDSRQLIAVVPNARSKPKGGPFGGRPMGGGRGKPGPLQPWDGIMRQAARLKQSQQVVRCMIARHKGQLVWGMSVDKTIGQIAVRSAESQWADAKVEPWPLDETGTVSDTVLPDQPGGGAVVRIYLEPEHADLPLHTPTETPDHPLSQLIDVLNDYPAVDAQLRIDLLPVTPRDRNRVCAQNLKSLEKTFGDDPPGGQLWTAPAAKTTISGVRILLRVARAGAGHAAECEQATRRLVQVLETNWESEHNRLVGRAVSDHVFDEMWTRGVLEKTVPTYHFDVLRTLLGPPSGKARQGAKQTVAKRLPDPPVLETFDPRSSDCLKRLMPIGVLAEEGRERMVGVPWGSNIDALFDWTVGGTGSGKTWHALSRVATLAETGKGFLFLDPARTAVKDIKQFIGARHADRILELDMQATGKTGPLVAGWNPLDLTVVPERMRQSRIDNLKGSLPAALFPQYFGPNVKPNEAPQTKTVIRNGLACLLELNFHLPPHIQANIFCLDELLRDGEWRELVVDKLDPLDQVFWHTKYPLIVGDDPESSTYLRPTFNALEQWRARHRLYALLGASVSTVRWRDIMENEKIVFVVLNNDESDEDKLLARLIVQEMVTAFKERGFDYVEEKIRPFHLFLDEFQSYASVIKAQSQVFVQELRKFGAKVHFLNQAPSALDRELRSAIQANRTHLFCGLLGEPRDAKAMAEAMGGGQSGGPQTMYGPAAGGNDPKISAQDLLDLPKWEFICQVTQDGKRSSAFQLKGINAKTTWAHLMSDRDVTEQILENTGVRPLRERLNETVVLADRIRAYLETGHIPEVETILAEKHRAYRKHRQQDQQTKETIRRQQQTDFPPEGEPPELAGQTSIDEQIETAEQTGWAQPMPEKE